MKIFYIGDIVGEPGIMVVQKVLPEIKKQYAPDIVIAQGENVTNGKGMSVADMQRLQTMGVDFFTGGNHTLGQKDLIPLLEDDSRPVIGPSNINGMPGKGWKYIETAKGLVLVVSVMGAKVGRAVEISNPLLYIDEVLSNNIHTNRVATIVNFHGDFSSEKRVIGYYLDGRVSAVIGDHWHVPTADAMVLPKGTAHITDVGMCGSLHSSLGVKTEVIIKRWRDGKINKNILETEGPSQFNAVLVETNKDGLAKSIKQIQQIL